MGVSHKEMAERHLLSDMEAFKAANPGCCLEDFVRWHSPKDWIAEDGLDLCKGKLSVRMSESSGLDNIWHKLWKEAKKIPVEKQTPLFNQSEEGLKLLDYFRSLTLQELLTQYIANLFKDYS